MLRKCWSVRCGADRVSARLRIVLDQPSPLAWPGSRGVRGSCGTRQLRPPASLLHNAALPSVPASRGAKAPLGAGQRCAPYRVKATGVMQSGLHLESVAQPSTLPGRWHALRAAVCAALWLSWHLGIGQALRAVCLVSGLRPVMWCVPPPTLVLRRCAASALRAGLPVRPPWGLPQPARLGCSYCYIFRSFSRKVYGGYRPKRPVSQRDRWLTSFGLVMPEVPRRYRINIAPQTARGSLC